MFVQVVQCWSNDPSGWTCSVRLGPGRWGVTEYVPSWTAGFLKNTMLVAACIWLDLWIIKPCS